MGRARWGAEKERHTSTVINNGSRQNQQKLVKRCPQYMATIKNQAHPLLVHCSETKKKKYLSQIHINTRLQLFYYHYFLKFFLLVFARPRYLITIYIHSATTTRGRHRAWKSFSVSTSVWVVHRIPLTLHVERDYFPATWKVIYLPAFSKS